MPDANVDEMARLNDIPGLIAALKDDDHWVREAAATALGRVGDESHIGPR